MSENNESKETKDTSIEDKQPKKDKNLDYEALYHDVKKESSNRKETLKKLDAEKSELATQKAELEAKLKNFEEMSKKEQEQKLKENQDYKALIELKEQEIAKLKSDYEPTKKELEELRTLKTQLQQKERNKRESLLNEIRTIAKKQNNDSYIVIGRSIKDNNALEKYLKSIPSVEGKKVPTYDGKPVSSPKPVGTASYNENSLSDLQKLFVEDRNKYDEIINNKRKGIKK